MRTSISFVVETSLILFLATALQAEIRVEVDHNDRETGSPAFKFENVPPPSNADAAGVAKLTIVDGRPDRNGARVETLVDGRGPRDEDQPSANFFFAAGTEGGRLLLDLGAITKIRMVNTYSWHSNTRGPQVYTLFGADGESDDFALEPKQEADPEKHGWTCVAHIDTRPHEGRGGGQYAVSISDSEDILGKYRYLLFDIVRTEAMDPFGNTFYSEIDVDDGKDHPPSTPAIPEPRLETVEAGEGAYQIIIDTTETPDLSDWVHEELAPVVREWYPKIVDLLPSEGYEPPKTVVITFGAHMRGVAATGGTRVQCAATWMRQNLRGEAKGAIVHELVHVVQQYGRARRPGAVTRRNPGWLVEGIADYIRWFLYEPESRGAEIAERNIPQARYDASYRVSANFLNWVSNTYDRGIVAKLNAAAREGRYTADLWKEFTGRTLEELGVEWKAQLKGDR